MCMPVTAAVQLEPGGTKSGFVLRVLCITVLPRLLWILASPVGPTRLVLLPTRFGPCRCSVHSGAAWSQCVCAGYLTVCWRQCSVLSDLEKAPVFRAMADPRDARIAELAALLAASEAARLVAEEELAATEASRLAAEEELDALRRKVLQILDVFAAILNWQR
ncbi:hypothetical protein D9Q98_004031 [Chlorella vulgaris]|uniref:Uncharacterized protein n=1 Tax=Chlorella vulgaris TaxID=3077 RepID=A0A9D4TSF4_CHLVU|nr:hypothetical protein D9Q98_004031 [Chlorella vulgaris]